MRIVHFADLHLGTLFRWVPPEVARQRRQALRDTLVRIADVTREVRADALLCGGDLYEHERFTPDTAAFLRTAFERIHPTPVYIAPGNHDWYGPQSLYRQVEWTPNVHVFAADRLEPIALSDGLTLWGAAHRAPANTDGFLDDFRVERGGVHLALFHGSERTWLGQQGEGKQPHAPFNTEQIEQAGLHHAFLGHYHRPRDAERHTYPGNPEPLAFGEDGDRGVVIADVAGEGGVRCQRRTVAVTMLHDLTVDISGCSSTQDIRERVAGACAGLDGIARITLNGDLAAGVELRLDGFSDVLPGMEATVVRLGDVRPDYDLVSLQQEPTVRGQFVRDVTSAALDADLQRRVLVTGLRALDGRDDLEVP